MKKILIFIILILLSKPTATQWVLDYNFNNSSISVSSISVSDSNYIWFSTIVSGLYGHLYKKINGNINVLNLPGQLRPGKIIAKDTSKLFLNSVIENRLFYTSNSGLNWIVSLDSILSGMTIYFAIASNDPNFIIAARSHFQDSTTSIFYKSTNGGINWQSQLLDLTKDYRVSNLSITDKDHINIGINCINNCIVMQYLYSTNGGINWLVKSFPPISNNLGISAPVFKKDNLFGFTFSPGYYYYIYNTTNGGINWTQPTLFISGGTSGVVRLMNIDSTSIWICATNDKVFKTTNDGTNWFLMNISLESQDIIRTMDIIIKENKYYGYIGTYFGKIYRLVETIIPIGINPISTEIPKSYSLSQNYPNPFNPTTKIKFELPKAGFVKIITYDAVGREINTLVNENLQAGIYETDIDASSLPSGVYFYKIEAGDFVNTKKMILIK